MGSIARVDAVVVMGLCAAVDCAGIVRFVLAVFMPGCCFVACSACAKALGVCTAGCFMDCCLAIAGYGAETPGSGRETVGILGREGFDPCILAAGCDTPRIEVCGPLKERASSGL